MELTLREQFVEEVRSRNLNNASFLFETSNGQYISWLEKKISQSDKTAVGFAKYCTESQVFGLYGYHTSLKLYKKENNL